MATGSKRLMFAVSPLFNFHSANRDPIHVLPGVLLRPTTQEDLGKGPGPNSMMEFMLRQVPMFPSTIKFDWVLAGEWIQTSGAGVLESLPMLEAFNRTVEALHLLHDEMVSFPFMLNGEGHPPNYLFGSSGFPFPTNDAWQKALNQPYLLSESEQPEVSSLAKAIEALTRDASEGAAVLAISRLNLTHLRSSDADRIIDAAVALEAILLKGAEGEYSYRQAVRGAHLLGGTPDDRRMTFSLLRRAYDRRSKIVHGARDPMIPSTAEIMTVTRRVVRKFVESLQSLSHDELIEALDHAAIGGP